MKQTIAMKQAAFEELMREHGFQYLGATTYDGSFIYQRTWHRTDEVGLLWPHGKHLQNHGAHQLWGADRPAFRGRARTWHPRLFQPQAGNQRHPGNPPVCWI